MYETFDKKNKKELHQKIHSDFFFLILSMHSALITSTKLSYDLSAAAHDSERPTFKINIRKNPVIKV